MIPLYETKTKEDYIVKANKGIDLSTAQKQKKGDKMDIYYGLKQ